MLSSVREFGSPCLDATCNTPEMPSSADRAPTKLTIIALEPGALRLADLRRIARGPVALTLADGDRRAIADSAAIVARIVREGATVYGVNTGFGKLAQVSIPPDQLEQLQHNLVLSHCAGTGAPLGDYYVTTPEPPTMLLLGVALVLVWAWRLRDPGFIIHIAPSEAKRLLNGAKV